MSDIVFLEKTDIGATLTTWIYCAFWQMFAAQKLGLRSHIHWPRDHKRALVHYYDDKKFDEIPNMFEWYFEQPMTPSTRQLGESGGVPYDTWEWEKPSPEFGRALGEHQLYANCPQIRGFYRQYLQFNDTVHARGETLRQKYNIDFSNTIGVTWRGTDSIIDGRPRMPIETYYPFIDDILERDPGLRILATAEEEGVIDTLLRKYPQAFTISELFMSPPGKRSLGDNPERFSALSGFERGMQPALMVWLFSKCAHYVKNRSSVAAVASWLSGGDIVSLAHPENLGHGFDITKAEVGGKVVPLNRK